MYREAATSRKSGMYRVRRNHREGETANRQALDSHQNVFLEVVAVDLIPKLGARDEGCVLRDFSPEESLCQKQSHQRAGGRAFARAGERAGRRQAEGEINQNEMKQKRTS